MPPGLASESMVPISTRNIAALPGLVEKRLGRLVLDRAEAVEAAEVVHAVHAENPTAIVLWRFELFGRAHPCL